MIRYFPSILSLVIALSASAFSQTTPPATPDPAPTPKPAVKRRSFDQFDLSNGISINSGRDTSGVSNVPPSGLEFVDQRTYDAFVKLVEYVAEMETGYRLTAGMEFDPVDIAQPERVLSKKLNSTYRLTELFSEGLLDHSRFTNQFNLDLLSESQMIIREALAVAAVRGDWTRNERKLMELAAKYNAEKGYTDDMARKRAILTAMLDGLHGDLTQLKNQIAVSK
ncbi:MAG: hypothetical protein ABI646_00995 [Acidobacteriota bacterium]